MINYYTEMLDHILTQSIERYTEMTMAEARKSIAKEWPVQLAVLLEEVFFRTTCGDALGMTRFVYAKRDDGQNCYLVPICHCDIDAWDPS